MRNKVQLIGNLGADPEVVTYENGSKRAKFSMATNEVYRNGEGEKQTDTQWHQVVAWGRLADLAESYLFKGKEVGVEGKLMTRSYLTDKDEKRYFTEIRCDELLLLGRSTVALEQASVLDETEI
ncbi:single-stranded DNA-binding protein [Aureicoccus marinus]|uniref:Single-stranded DNA-binding protein n=1 Tax=Aureicoccus marinus TaxID=754435 RepID=A0A2S7T7Y5_9FLAO|nr:single-stranded DNA-binding protein [Aureicoccus marinus]PQJ16042.1 single-stranded DNA-binding protein [Aureicoccus marinus]